MRHASRKTRLIEESLSEAGSEAVDLPPSKQTLSRFDIVTFNLFVSAWSFAPLRYDYRKILNFDACLFLVTAILTFLAFLPLPSLKLQNLESVQTKLKFCSHLSKVPKGKPKVNKVHCNLIIPLKLHEILLVLWNLSKFCKILKFLDKFGKSLKDLRKILLKWLRRTVKYWLDFINFHSCTVKWAKVGQTSSITLMKVCSIQRMFYQS